MSENANSRRRFLKGAAFAGAAVAAGGLPMNADDKPVRPAGPTFDVRRLGAVGDGATDDTPSIQAAIDAGIKAGGGHVYFPSGKYRVTRSLVFTGADRFDVTGDGRTSILLHENDEPLLLWNEDAPCRESTISNLAFHSVTNDRSPDVPVIACHGGTERSMFTHLFFTHAGIDSSVHGIHQVDNS